MYLKNFLTSIQAKKIYLYEESEFLKDLQKKNVLSTQIKWIKDFKGLR
jgi:hypothetical protein